MEEEHLGDLGTRRTSLRYDTKCISSAAFEPFEHGKFDRGCVRSFFPEVGGIVLCFGVLDLSHSIYIL